MRQLGEDEAIFDGAGLALIGIADDVFFRSCGLADGIPLQMRREAGATHAAQASFFEVGQEGIEIASLQKILEGGVGTLAFIWVARELRLLEAIAGSGRRIA